MKFKLLVSSCALCVLLNSPGAWAGGVVAGCSEIELRTAMLGGGVVTFNKDCSITVLDPIYVAPGSVVTIDAAGHNVTLSGGGAVPVFSIEGDITLRGLTITGGRGAYGGAMYISSAGNVFATNCTFAGNAALGTNGVAGTDASDSSGTQGPDGTSGTSGTSALGGAINNAGVLTLWHCTLATNSVTAGDGGAGGKGGGAQTALGQGGNGGNGGSGGSAYGGAVYNSANLSVVDCTFIGNTVKAGSGAAGGAGGAAAFNGKAGMGGVGGTAGGAAIYNTKYVVLRGSTFNANTSVGGKSADGGTQSNGNGASGPNGGGALGASLVSTLWGVATNCTFFDEMVIGGAAGNGGPSYGALNTSGDGGDGGSGIGGAVYSYGTFRMVNCTVANCAAVGGTNGVAGSGSFNGHDGNPGPQLGGGIANGGTFTLQNTLLSTNAPGGNGNGTFVDAGNNLSSDGSIAMGGFTRTDPKVGTLADNGGPTKTVALLTGSPAINAAGANFPLTDQRGVPRPQGPRADIGAFEQTTTPTILVQPVDQTAPYGGSATFSVSALGTSLRYQWRFAGTNIPSGVNPTLTLANVTMTNAGAYRVIITNTYGTAVSDPANLIVGPHIVTGPTNLEVAVNNPAGFSVDAVGSAPLFYQWYFNGTNALGNGPNYSIASAQTNNAGAYTVVITNVAGAVTSAPATLLVDVITTQPASQTVAVGSNVVLSVNATGSNLKYAWVQNETNTIATAVAPNYSFTAKKSDAGTYEATVYNTLVSMRSAPAMLVVLAPPVFTNTPPASLVVTQGQAVTLQAGATGDSLTYQWYFQGAALPGASGTSYTIPAAEPADTGTYMIKATNAAASASSSTALRVLPPGNNLQASVSSNLLSIVYPTTTNVSYVLQYKNSLGDASWTAMRTNPGTGNLVTNQDLTTNQPGRFYRVTTQ